LVRHAERSGKRRSPAVDALKHSPEPEEM